jgi:hypothetical protein
MADKVVASAAGRQSGSIPSPGWISSAAYDTFDFPVPEALNEPQSTEDRLAAAIAPTNQDCQINWLMRAR